MREERKLNDSKRKVKVVNKLIKQCGQSKLLTFSYQDEMLAIHYRKEDFEADYSTNMTENIIIENTFNRKKNNSLIDLDEEALEKIYKWIRRKRKI